MEVKMIFKNIAGAVFKWLIFPCISFCGMLPQYFRERLENAYSSRRDFLTNKQAAVMVLRNSERPLATNVQLFAVTWRHGNNLG